MARVINSVCKCILAMPHQSFKETRQENCAFRTTSYMLKPTLPRNFSKQKDFEMGSKFSNTQNF